MHRHLTIWMHTCMWGLESWLKALSTLRDNQSLLPYIHVWHLPDIELQLYLQFQGIWCPLLASSGNSHMWHVFTKTQTLNDNLNTTHAIWAHIIIDFCLLNLNASAKKKSEFLFHWCCSVKHVCFSKSGVLNLRVATSFGGLNNLSQGSPETIRKHRYFHYSS